jgi:DNA-binding IclR family transcriptional regulator
VESSKQAGTQSLARAAALLRELAARGRFGWGLGDLSARCGLDKGTAHRLLAHLKRERMVQQRPGDRRYVPGPLMYELGLALTDYAAFQEAAEAPLARLVKQFGGAAFLFLRSGSDFVCAARVSDVPVKALSIEVGTRRPLLTSAGGIAMLIAMPASEARSVIAQNRDLVARFGGASPAALEKMLKASRRHGIAVNERNLIPGWNAYALAVRNGAGEPFASVMLAGEASQLSLADHPELVKFMSAESAALADAAARLLGSGSP